MCRQERSGRNSLRRQRATQPCRANGRRRRNVTNVMHYRTEKTKRSHNFTECYASGELFSDNVKE
jgi:hypothetical protein